MYLRPAATEIPMYASRIIVPIDWPGLFSKSMLVSSPESVMEECGRVSNPERCENGVAGMMSGTLLLGMTNALAVVRKRAFEFRRMRAFVACMICGLWDVK